MEKRDRVFGLDVLRASAIGLVLLSHATLFAGSRSSLFGPGLLAGYFGVELFFVLSGFLIGSILLRACAESDSTGATLRKFWIRRWFRTLPAYFLFLAVNIALALAQGRALPPIWQYGFFLQNFVTPPPHFFVESWSLAVEEWFYLLLPLLVLVWPRRTSLRKHTALVLLLGILAVTVARTLYVAVADPVWLTDVRMIVVFRLDACMFGVAGAWWKYYHPRQWSHSAKWLLPAGLLVLGSVAFAPFALAADSTFMRTSGFTLTSVGALLILPALDRWRAGGKIASAVITRISLWSYSLYLVNYPIFTLLKTQAMAPLPLALVFCGTAISAAALLYHFYELPLMNLRDRWPARKRPEPAAASAVLVQG